MEESKCFQVSLKEGDSPQAKENNLGTKRMRMIDFDEVPSAKRTFTGDLDRAERSDNGASRSGYSAFSRKMMVSWRYNHSVLA